jgi:hypothetical protein
MQVRRRYARSKKQVLRSARHSPRLPTYQVMKIRLVIFSVLLIAALGLAGCGEGRRDYGGYGYPAYGYGYPSYFGYGGFGRERFRGFHDGFHGGEHRGEFHGDAFHGGGFHGGGFHGGGHR